MPSFCHNLSSHYAHLRTLADAFTTEYERVKDAGDLTDVRKLRDRLEEARDSLLEPLCVFRVPDAKNPYHEALLEAGLDPNETQEREEMMVDIREEIKRQLAVYREVTDATGQPILQDWIKNISEDEGLLYAEVAKDRAKIMERIKAGMIPIVMPSRTVQERSWKVALTHLTPTWIESRSKKAAQDSYVMDIYEQENMYVTEFLKNIPNRPYLVWTKPTQKPDHAPYNSSFAVNQAYYAGLVSERPQLFDKTDLIPTEYIALQSIFTTDIRERYREINSGIIEPITINPLDSDTSAHFLSAGAVSGGEFPLVYLLKRTHRVYFIADNENRSRSLGFRPASRT